MRHPPLAVAVSLTLFVALSARAEFPFHADANRCDSSGNPPGCIPLPNEMSNCNGEMWKFASTSVCTTDPTVLNSPNELFGVSGMSVETAWRLETGRPDVVIAVLDSGIKWNDLGALNDLRKKFYLNRGELPVPQCAPPGPPGPDPYDCNGDGVFNAPDYDHVTPVRVGDSFVAEVNRFAQGVVFAVDTGAAVIQEALGTLNNSAFGQESVDYAYRHNVPVMASAADEDSWHHNYPSNYVHTIVVNSIRDFGLDAVEPQSWLFIDGCTNFGGNVSVSVSSTSCSSEATGRSSGIM